MQIERFKDLTVKAFKEIKQYQAGEKGIVKKLYEQEVSEDLLLKIEKFAYFAENSNGFAIT